MHMESGTDFCCENWPKIALDICYVANTMDYCTVHCTLEVVLWGINNVI